mmetsp:Transcript_84941/g.240553  ORF Transcript_84941/g.240553 Transcript_84941/m.240553 type:complete len:230 (+) Transcript_84941:441-1130(+)
MRGLFTCSGAIPSVFSPTSTPSLNTFMCPDADTVHNRVHSWSSTKKSTTRTLNGLFPRKTVKCRSSVAPMAPAVMLSSSASREKSNTRDQWSKPSILTTHMKENAPPSRVWTPPLKFVGRFNGSRRSATGCATAVPTAARAGAERVAGGPAKLVAGGMAPRSTPLAAEAHNAGREASAEGGGPAPQSAQPAAMGRRGGERYGNVLAAVVLPGSGAYWARGWLAARSSLA